MLDCDILRDLAYLRDKGLSLKGIGLDLNLKISANLDDSNSCFGDAGAGRDCLVAIGRYVESDASCYIGDLFYVLLKTVDLRDSIICRFGLYRFDFPPILI